MSSRASLTAAMIADAITTSSRYPSGDVLENRTGAAYYVLCSALLCGSDPFEAFPDSRRSPLNAMPFAARG